MSRTYRCHVKKDIEKTYQVGEKLEYQLSFLNILEEEEIQNILKNTLKELGGQSTNSQEIQLNVDGETVIFDIKNKKASILVNEKTTVRTSIDTEIEVYNFYDNPQEAQEEAEKKAEVHLQKELENKKAYKIQQIKEKIDRKEKKLRTKLREIINEVNKNILRKKASQIGKILEDKEEILPNNTNRLTLEVEVDENI